MSASNKIVSSHWMTVSAVVCEDGSAHLCGVTTGSLPAGVEIVGNGTLQHPLNVKLSPELAAAIERANVAVMPKAPRLVICLDGGLVQEIYSEGLPTDLPIAVIDYDHEGADEDEVATVDHGDGHIEMCVPSGWNAKAENCDPYFAALDQRNQSSEADDGLSTRHYPSVEGEGE